MRVESTTAPNNKSCGHPHDRIVQSVNVFDYVSETRMKLQPARGGPRVSFPEQYLQVLFSGFVPEIPYLERSRYTIEGDKQADKVHREVRCSPYCDPISRYPFDMWRRWSDGSSEQYPTGNCCSINPMAVRHLRH